MSKLPMNGTDDRWGKHGKTWKNYNEWISLGKSSLVFPSDFPRSWGFPLSIFPVNPCDSPWLWLRGWGRVIFGHLRQQEGGEKDPAAHPENRQDGLFFRWSKRWIYGWLRIMMVGWLVSYDDDDDGGYDVVGNHQHENQPLSHYQIIKW